MYWTQGFQKCITMGVIYNLVIGNLRQKTKNLKNILFFSREDLNNSKLYIYYGNLPIKKIDILSVENSYIHSKYLF